MSKEIKSAEDILKDKFGLMSLALMGKGTIQGILEAMKEFNQQFQAPVTDEEIATERIQSCERFFIDNDPPDYTGEDVYHKAFNDCAKWMRDKMASDNKSLLDRFITEIETEFKDQNWDYLHFIAERVLNKPNS